MTLENTHFTGCKCYDVTNQKNKNKIKVRFDNTRAVSGRGQCKLYCVLPS